MKRLIRFAALACAVSITACGGGGGGNAAAVPVATAAPSTQPTATPSPVPTATPAPVTPQASATTLAFASNAPATLTVTETGYTGAFVETDSCAPLTGTIATVHVNATVGTASFTITPTGAGTCQISVSDSAGHAVVVPVTVSTFAVTVQ